VTTTTHTLPTTTYHTAFPPHTHTPHTAHHLPHSVLGERRQNHHLGRAGAHPSNGGTSRASLEARPAHLGASKKSLTKRAATQKKENIENGQKKMAWRAEKKNEMECVHSHLKKVSDKQISPRIQINNRVNKRRRSAWAASSMRSLCLILYRGRRRAVLHPLDENKHLRRRKHRDANVCA